MRRTPQQSASLWLRLSLAAMLLASHGLLLAHSGEHLFETGNPVCDVCTAGQSFSAAAVDATSVPDCSGSFGDFNTASLVSADVAVPFSSDPARAPPVILLTR